VADAKLELHVRRLSSFAADSGEFEVYCPNRDGNVAVNLCKTCGEFVASGADPQTSRVFVECRRLTPDSERTLRAARRAILSRRGGGSSIGDATPITEIMTRVVPCVRAGLELAGLRALFTRDEVAAVPVVNEHGEPIGILTPGALVAAPPGGKARDLMSRLNFVLPESATVSQAAALMALERMAYLPIVTGEGRVSGMVSWLDVLRWFAQADGYVVPERE
jgi:CBS domain-containing protein